MSTISAGATISASNSFTLNASPRTTPATIGMPATASHAAPTFSAIISESIVSLCAVRIAAGRTASASPAPSPAVRPNMRRTRSYSSGIATIAARTSGSRTDTPSKPNSFTAATCSHRSAGALSTATCPPGSIAPKKKLCHDWLMLRTAAS